MIYIHTHGENLDTTTTPSPTDYYWFSIIIKRVRSLCTADHAARREARRRRVEAVCVVINFKWCARTHVIIIIRSLYFVLLLLRFYYYYYYAQRSAPQTIYTSHARRVRSENFNARAASLCIRMTHNTRLWENNNNNILYKYVRNARVD